MVHVLPIVAMIGHPLLLAMGRVIGPIQVQHEGGRHARTLALLEVQPH